ncbi:helix-turn-helix transcriptional regulator [Streptomyces sp. NPDC059566]|uniref:helix-turn-helix transcriptional regulator n=1 Tax=Streptomyces sp. NPDC059566 TaxID=3346866 RepID=UPI0036990EF4
MHPEDVALPDFGGRRRVAGLRREEIAQLAGVSVDYNTRMEQGRVSNPSDAVLDALARALRLDGDATRHLHRLARPQSSARNVPRRQAQPQRVRPMLQKLLDDLVDMPAMVMGRRTDVLAWNAAAVALFDDYAALDRAERNIARITFPDETSWELYADWPSCARGNVAYLHMDAGRHPDDPELASLIGELSMKSADFRRWWAEHPVQDKTSGTKRFHLGHRGPLPDADRPPRPLTFRAVRASPPGAAGGANPLPAGPRGVAVQPRRLEPRGDQGRV